MVKNSQKKRVKVVVGLGYGDEGKGLVTDYLCSNSLEPIVIRFNGGQQAGHTVITETGIRHVFSNFGSGTLRGVPTYWTNFCTFSPLHFLDEYDSLTVKPLIFIDDRCSVTTHYDILFSRAVEASRGDSRYGSCGVGYGATVERSKIENLQIFVSDLMNPMICSEKLELIKSYYKRRFKFETIYDFNKFSHEEQDEAFISALLEFNKLVDKQIVSIVNEEEFLADAGWATYIFEGAQGVLLDQSFGTTPYITKSNTTSKNVFDLLSRNGQLSRSDIEIFYVTRSYLTRHGGGPFKEVLPQLKLVKNKFETNVENEYQGRFKIAYLDLNLLNYALKCDHQFSEIARKHLIITCCDQFQNQTIPLLIDGSIRFIDPIQLKNYIGEKFDEIKLSYGPTANDVI